MMQWYVEQEGWNSIVKSDETTSKVVIKRQRPSKVHSSLVAFRVSRLLNGHPAENLAKFVKRKSSCKFLTVDGNFEIVLYGKGMKDIARSVFCDEN